MGFYKGVFYSNYPLNIVGDLFEADELSHELRCNIKNCIVCLETKKAIQERRIDLVQRSFEDKQMNKLMNGERVMLL